MLRRKEPITSSLYGVMSSRHVDKRALSRRPHSAMTAYTVHTDVHGSVQIDCDVATEARGVCQDEWNPYVRRSAARNAGRLQTSIVQLYGTIDRHGEATERLSRGLRAISMDTRRVRRSESQRPTPEPRRPGQWNETTLSRPLIRQRKRLEADRRTIHRFIREQRPPRRSVGSRELADAVERLSCEYETENVAAHAQQDSTTHDVQVRSNP